MSNYEKKVYSLEDNVKYISFGIKDIVKELKELNMLLNSLINIKNEKPPF